MTETINIHIHASHGEKIKDDTSRFRLHRHLNLIGKQTLIQLTDFQCLNTIYNVRKEDTLCGKSFGVEGFFDAVTLLRKIYTLLPPSIQCFFNEETLKYSFQSEGAFTLTGSILHYLNIENHNAVLEDGMYVCESARGFDLYKRSHSVFVMIENLKSSSNVAIEDETQHLHGKIGKVPIKASFGEYIIVHNTNGVKHLLFENQISYLDIQLKNDLNESILMNEDFSMTFRLEVTQLEGDFLIDEFEPPKRGVFSGIQYPVVNKKLVFLKNTRERYEEFKKESIKNSLLKNGIDEDEIDNIEMKLKQINELVQERK